MKKPANYYQGIGRPIFIASVEEEQLHANQIKESDLLNLSSDESHHNLSILHNEHESLSPEKSIFCEYLVLKNDKVTKSFRANDRKDGAYDVTI